MDSDTLLNCGRASERLFKLVSDRQVWRQLLKKIPEFSKSKVQELKGLQSPQGSKVSLEMVQEVAMEVARRIQFSEHLFLSTCDLGQLEGEERAKAIQDMVKIMKEQIKVTVSVEAGWGNSDFVVEGEKLEELTALAKVVDVKIKLTKVEFPSMPHMGILKEISSHMEQQMEQLEELKVSLLELSNEPPREGNTHGDLHMEREATNLYMSLMSRANSWEIDTLTLAQSKAHFSTNDNYTRLHHRPYPPHHQHFISSLLKVGPTSGPGWPTSPVAPSAPSAFRPSAPRTPWIQ